MERLSTSSMPGFPRPRAEFEHDFAGVLEHMFWPKIESWSELMSWSPRTTVVETLNELELTVDLPGMQVRDVRVELHEGDLCISGAVQTEAKGKPCDRVRRRYEFHLVLPLPASADRQAFNARLTDGVLKIVIPKTEEARSTAVLVTAA